MFLTRVQMDAHIQSWLSNLLRQEDRDTYANMTMKQQTVVKLAFRYGQITQSSIPGE